METFSSYFDQVMSMVITYAPKVLLAIVILIVGFIVISKVTKMLTAGLSKSNLSEELRKFFSSLLNVLLKVLLIFSIAGILGVETTSFIAILGAATLAIGMALQGSLGNFASGVMILFFRPYKIGDVVELAGTVGEVLEIQIFNTILQTPTNKTIVVPNSIATSDKIVNYSTVGSIRIDTMINVGYDEDLDKIQDTIMKVIQSNPDILLDMPNAVAVESYEDHALKVGAFAFTTPDKYWKVYYDIRNDIKRALGAANVKAAYPIGIASGSISSK